MRCRHADCAVFYDLSVSEAIELSPANYGGDQGRVLCSSRSRAVLDTRLLLIEMFIILIASGLRCSRWRSGTAALLVQARMNHVGP